MMELLVTLEFACCTCEQSVRVTVKCAGKKLPAGVASVAVPCPSCGHVNQLSFEPNGTVRSVEPYTTPWPVPQPSLN
jgi:hypothetical protein